MSLDAPESTMSLIRVAGEGCLEPVGDGPPQEARRGGRAACKTDGDSGLRTSIGVPPQDLGDLGALVGVPAQEAGDRRTLGVCRSVGLGCGDTEGSL